MQAGVFGFVNDTHAAATEFFDDAVMRNGLANQMTRLKVDASIVGGKLVQVNGLRQVKSDVRSGLTHGPIRRS